MDVNNFVFPYKWYYGDIKPVLNELLVALIKKDFAEAKKYIGQLDELTCTSIHAISENPKLLTFERCLYEFLADYDTMKFLVENGFNVKKFSKIQCNGAKEWKGIVGQAYYANQDTRIVELLLSAGFTVFDHGGFIGKDHIPMWKAVMVYGFDRKIIDLMLAYGQSADDLLDDIKFSDDDPNYKSWAADYLRSRPSVVRKGGLNGNKSIAYQYSEDKYAQYDTSVSNDTKSPYVSREGCYIATAVYGGYDEPQVLILRKYRDEVLKQTAFGRLFVKIYYAISPSMAQGLKSCTWLNKRIRRMLDDFVECIENKYIGK